MKACRVEFNLLFLCLALEFLMSVTMWLKSCKGNKTKKMRGVTKHPRRRKSLFSYERAELLVFAAEKLEKELQNPNTERHDFPAVS